MQLWHLHTAGGRGRGLICTCGPPTLLAPDRLDQKSIVHPSAPMCSPGVVGCFWKCSLPGWSERVSPTEHGDFVPNDGLLDEPMFIWRGGSAPELGWSFREWMRFGVWRGGVE